MPKEVDHDARRRELAEAAGRVIARDGLAGATLALVAAESGWSIGSIRHYFPTKNDLLTSALSRVGERLDARIRRRTAGGMCLADLRKACVEFLPLDANRRDQSRIWLAFVAQAAVSPELADVAEQVARDIQAPFVARFESAIRTGELPPHLDPAREATRLRLLLDGLEVHLAMAPSQTSRRQALAFLDEHLAALVARRPPIPRAVRPRVGR